MPGPPTNDSLLQEFLFASDAEFREGLARLLAEHAQPIVRVILRSRRAAVRDPHDIEDEVMLRLIERLHQLRRRPDASPVTDIRAYAAAVTYHALAEQQRHDSRERHRIEADAGEDQLDNLPDPRPDAATDLELRTRLRDLWHEICRLPSRQCAALLLNLRDDHGRAAIVLLPLTGTASMREIAALMAMPAERFAELWNRLPLDDAAIAQSLGVTRQQVINLRKAARARLVRRMRRDG